MNRKDLMKPDLLSQIVPLGSAAVMVFVLLLILVAALTQATAPAWKDCGESLMRCTLLAPTRRISRLTTRQH